MSYIATLQTRMARADLCEAEANEHDHQRDCAACARARRRGERCPYGQCLYDIRSQAAARLREERKLDQAVPPGQMALF
jgi:hypothetical protein